MTKDVTFIFTKDTGSLALRFLDALQGTTPIAVKRDAISPAMSDIFERLIAKDAAKYKTAILGLSSFVVTFSNGDQPKLKVKSGEGDIEIHLNKLTAQTAALFSNSIYPHQAPPRSKEASTEEKARSSADKLRQESLPKVPDEEKSKKVQPLEPVPAAVAKPIVVQAVQVASTLPPSTTVVLPGPAAYTKTSVRREPTEQEKMFTGIFMSMNERFVNTMITRSKNIGQNFGDYLMARLFEQATSHHHNSETGEFTITFDKDQAFNLTKLPEEISAKTRAGLEQLQNSILKLPKQVKGKFSENKVSFEPGSLTITWPNSWTGAEAKLLEIYETQGETITMQIKYGKLPATLISVPAQDFANFVECNVTN